MEKPGHIQRRTDLAVEAHELWRESAATETLLNGVRAKEHTCEGMTVTTVEILDEQGAAELDKPIGKYITVELNGLARWEPEVFGRACRAVAEQLRSLIKVGDGDTILVAGLGNRAITPDSIGPLCCESVMVTRHLVERMPGDFGHMRPVAAITPGVLGTTGMESAEILCGVIKKAAPKAVIMIDALASRKLDRLCRTVQLSDTGIVPGSGVGNARAALNADTMGVPVISVGVPTVVDAATLAADISQAAGFGEIAPEELSRYSGGLIVTPKEIDSQVHEIARVIGYAVNLAAQRDISVEDITGYLA